MNQQLQELVEKEKRNKKSAEEKRQDEKILKKIVQNMITNPSNHQKFLTLAKAFKNARTNEERMQVSAKFYILLGGKNNYIEQRFNEVKDKQNFKDKEMSNKLRADGNTAYQKGDNMKALELYTKSVAYAPFDSPELALAYANRSAVLRTLGMCHDCLEDIQRAFNHGYPTEKSFKLLLREAQCYRDLGASGGAMTIYLKASMMLHSLPKEELSVLLKQLSEASEAPQKNVRVELVIYPEETPELSYGPNSETPCASSAVRIEYSEQQGRHLVATRDIKIGDILVLEENIAVTLGEEHKFSHCSHCHKLCRSLLPCRNCVWVMFCSKECQAEAIKKYHKAECAALSRFCHLNVKLLRDEIYERVIRIIALIGIPNLKPYLKYARTNKKQEVQKMSNEEKRTKGFNSKGVYDSSDFNTLFNMISLIELQDGEATLPPSVGTLQIPRCFGVSMEKNPDFFAIAGLCLQLEDSAYLTGLAKTYRYIKSPKDMERITPGHACNPLISLTNHSCVGNVRPAMYGNKKAVVAMWPIPKGTIITETYFHVAGTKSKKYRQTVLKNRYLFDCKCQACKEDWPIQGKMGVISDLADQKKADVFAREDIYSKLERTCPDHLSLTINELLQKRFDFLTRVWEKKEFLDVYCNHIQQQIQILYSY
ncbi:hypothetical protein B566_EDAN007661, partial [Ephemera danica]